VEAHNANKKTKSAARKVRDRKWKRAAGLMFPPSGTRTRAPKANLRIVNGNGKKFCKTLMQLRFQRYRNSKSDRTLPNFVTSQRFTNLGTRAQRGRVTKKMQTIRELECFSGFTEPERANSVRFRERASEKGIRGWRGKSDILARLQKYPKEAETTCL
jgi:hypothetical protein